MEKEEILIPDIFKAEDFYATKDLALGNHPYKAAILANARFKEWAGGLQKVYSNLKFASMSRLKRWKTSCLPQQ